MHRSTFSRSLGAMVVAFGLAACSADMTGPGGFPVADAELDQSIAADVGDAIGTSVDLMTADEASDGAGMSGSLVPPGAGINASVAPATAASASCSGPDSDGWYTCERTTWRGLSVDRQVRFWAGGSLALGWDPATTDSVNHRRTVTGSYSPAWNPARTIWVNRADTATMVVSRGTDTLHVWTGTGVRQDSSRYSRSTGVRVFHYTAHDTATAVAFQVPRAEHPWPQSGTVVHNVLTELVVESGSKTFTKTVTRRAVVTFNGTSSVTLQVGGLTCTLDLATHAVSGCHGS
jgi:hypothetical protein